jgi:hypothetical protein
MGDSFQTIVIRGARENEAALLGEKVLTHLVKQGIVAADMTDCVLGSDLGHPPGPNYRQALAEIETYDFLGMWTNGLAIITQPNFYWSMEGEHQVFCPACGNPADIELIGDPIEEWLKDATQGMLPCPKCNTASSITVWEYDPPAAFGCPAFQFWNWPPLSQKFIHELSEICGHEVVMIEGDL